ncbi:MAG: Ig-like domain-containing protein [Planctomycetaceae bacterium]
MLLANWLKLFARRLFSNRAIRKLPPPRNLRSRRRRAPVLSVRTERLEERVLLSGVAAEIDTYDLSTDGSLEGATSVLVNDAGEGLSAFQLTSPEYGELSFNTDGTFYYTPNPGWSGVDSFEYAATDGVDNASATVFLNVWANSVGEEEPASADPDESTYGDETGYTDGTDTSAENDAGSGESTDEYGSADDYGTGGGSEGDSADGSGVEDPTGSDPYEDTTTATDESSSGEGTEDYAYDEWTDADAGGTDSGTDSAEGGNDSTSEDNADSSANDEWSDTGSNDGSGDETSTDSVSESSEDASGEPSSTESPGDSSSGGEQADDPTWLNTSTATTLLARLGTAAGEYTTALATAYWMQVDADATAKNSYQQTVAAAEASWLATEQSIGQQYAAAVAQADAELSASDAVAQVAYNTGVASLYAAAELGAISDQANFDGAIVSADETYTAAATAASVAVNAAVAGANATETAANLADYATYLSTIWSLNQSSIAAAQAAADAYYAATGNPYTPKIDTSAIAQADSEFVAESARIASETSAAISTAWNGLLAAAAAAYDQYDAAAASADATYRGTVAGNAASYQSAAAQAVSKYNSTIDQIAASYAQAATEALQTYDSSVATADQAYASAMDAAAAGYAAKVQQFAETYVHALIDAQNQLDGDLADNAAQFESDKQNAIDGFWSSLVNAQAAYDQVANNPNSTSADLSAAAATRLRTIAHAVADFLGNIASAIAAKANADASAQATYANTVSAAAVACFQGNVQASADYTTESNAASAEHMRSLISAQSGYASTMQSAGSSAGNEAANAYHSAITSLINAERAQMEADAAAQDAYSQELFAASSTLDSTLVAAVLSYNSAKRAVSSQSTNERMEAYVDALDRWDQQEQTPESALALASVRATAAYWTGYVANDNAWYAAQDAHAAEWIGTVAAADATYFSQMSQASSTANGTVLSAIATLALSGADREQSLTTGISGLGSTLNSTLLTNATTWFGTVLSAGQSADDGSIANAVGRSLALSGAAQSLQAQLVSNTMGAISSVTAADTTTVSALGSTLISAYDTAGTAPESAEAESTPSEAPGGAVESYSDSGQDSGLPPGVDSLARSWGSMQDAWAFAALWACGYDEEADAALQRAYDNGPLGQTQNSDDLTYYGTRGALGAATASLVLAGGVAAYGATAATSTGSITLTTHATGGAHFVATVDGLGFEALATRGGVRLFSMTAHEGADSRFVGNRCFLGIGVANSP